MSITCDVLIKWSATPEQLAALGRALWHWCNRTAGNTGIYQYLDNQALADLMAGKLPVAEQLPSESDYRGAHFRAWDLASRNCRAAIETLRQELPTDGIEEVLVDGTSWNSADSEGRNGPEREITRERAPGGRVLHLVEQ